MKLHGKRQLDSVSVMPCPFEGEVARRTREDRQQLSVDAHGAARSGPVRNAELKREFCGFCGLNCQPGSLLFRERCFLTKSNSLPLPVELRRDEEVDINTAGVMEIDRVSEFCELLRSRPSAAPERLRR